jgi:2-polyprenyl-3-methyl-5-hydroxy-6-metoxy-1,4-benzoquinol methylase
MPVHQRYTRFQKDQRQFFDELVTEDWEAYRSDAWDFTRKFEIERLFRSIRPTNILDIGCGVGYHDLLMATYPFVENVHGIDYSEQSILRANQQYPHPKVSRFAGNYLEFNQAAKYDLVVSFQVFEHLEDPENYLRFSAENINSGGFAAICTPNSLRWENRMRHLLRQPAAMIDVMHFREYSPLEIYDMGARFGLRPAEWFGHSLVAPFTSKLDFRVRTKLGYYLPWFSNVICVLLHKPE